MKWLIFALTVVAVILGGLLSVPVAAQDRGGGQTAALPEKQSGLDGGAVFQRYCGQCHGERYPTERTRDRWTIIATHMRVRAHLTGKEAEAVLSYLQANAREKKQAPEPSEPGQPKKQAPPPAASERKEIKR
jgi:mono/diheme cytochrome c family protein